LAAWLRSEPHTSRIHVDLHSITAVSASIVTERNKNTENEEDKEKKLLDWRFYHLGYNAF
jgi:hypothetical protein